MTAKFQQRHFEAIAEVIQDLTKGAERQALPTVVRIDRMTREFANLFARENDLFDRGRFERACVPGADVRARS